MNSSKGPAPKAPLAEVAASPETTTGAARQSAAPGEPDFEQVALITGCASGIGRGTALAFAALNYRLVLVDKRREPLGETARLCMERSPQGYKPLELALDLSEGEQVAKSVVERCLSYFGRLDALINNAGITALTKFDDPDCIQLYHKIMATNQHACLYLCLAAYQALKAQAGSIVNVSSVLDNEPARHKFAYCMSKASLTMMTKCLAGDFAPHVRVNCVSPGPVASSILDDIGVSLDKRTLDARNTTLVQRIGQPEEVARMIVYLSAKNKASFITGTRVLVDGGWTLRAPRLGVDGGTIGRGSDNISGIKLRGASFLMHHVYDDEMTFKLVSAASTVSGLSVEQCLEQFGRHFLVYCQKNGYDQILRVLGSNLYDFLTNLDNLHDHLASIYPGMRAPSFRVTRHINTNHRPAGLKSRALDEAGSTVAGAARQQLSFFEELPATDELNGSNDDGELSGAGDELHKQNASCSLLSGSMYLHYYSDRTSLSPIVKGLVMAVAHEFFQVDILVSECQLAGAGAGDSCSPGAPDDHVIFRIDRAAGKGAEPDCSKVPEETVSASITDTSGAHRKSLASATVTDAATGAEARGRTKPPVSSADGLGEDRLSKLNIYDCLSTNARDSLVSSEIMMRTFPFHVIFDRQFNLVQVGNALLRCTSRLWRRRQVSDPDGLVGFGDLFRIVRPKIEFTFAAIADHTNQVFVVKTLPKVLNIEWRPGGDASPGDSRSCMLDAAGRRRGSQRRPPPPHTRPADSTSLRGPVCPFNRLAEQRRATSGCPANPTTRQHALEAGLSSSYDQEESPRTPQPPPPASVLCPESLQEEPPNPEDTSESSAELRLKGQMIILLGGQLCLYLCSPRVDNLGQLSECGISMSDFALHDRVRELMLMSHTHKEDREAVKKLDQATNDLKKMETKLRQENERTNEVLHNIFPAKIAKILSQGVKVESETFEMVSCLYSDIIGFTKMCGSENVKPIDIVRLLNTMYLQFDNLTNIHGVFKVETIGDAYVVVGGLPEPTEDHADRCVKMGLDMVKVIGSVRSPADNQPIQMRIGIHSGPVMAGIVGIRVPRYSLFGNTTTIANQLETHGVAGKIHISDFTLRNLIKRERFVVEDNRSEINGIPFVTYFVTNYLRDPSESRQHECLLKEQLIKDLELLGNAELELVDDSPAPTSSAPAPQDGRHKPEQQSKLQSPSPYSSRAQPAAAGSYLNRSAAATSGALHAKLRGAPVPLSDALTGADKRGPVPLTKDLEASSHRPARVRSGIEGRMRRRRLASGQLLAYSCQLAASVLDDSMEQVATRMAGFLAASSLRGPPSCPKCSAHATTRSREMHKDEPGSWLTNGQLMQLPVSSCILKQTQPGLQLAAAARSSASHSPAGLEFLLGGLRSEQRRRDLEERIRPGDQGAGKTATTSAVAFGRPLSSEVQRIKRMDTLKSRRLKRKRQQQQQLSQAAPQAAPHQLAPCLGGSVVQRDAMIVEETEEAAFEHACPEQEEPKSAAKLESAGSHWGARFHLVSPLASLARQLAFSASPKRQPASKDKPPDYYNVSNSRRGCFCLGSSASSQSLAGGSAGRKLRPS